MNCVSEDALKKLFHIQFHMVNRSNFVLKKKTNLIKIYKRIFSEKSFLKSWKQL